MQYTLNTHNIRHLLSKHNTVTTPHSHLCNPISYVNSPARLTCVGGKINRIHSSAHSQFIGDRQFSGTFTRKKFVWLPSGIWSPLEKSLLTQTKRTIACADSRWLGLCGILE